MILSEVQIRSIVNFLNPAIKGLHAIYIFGSGATEDFTDQSDVDLAILAEKATDPLALWEYKFELSKIVGREVDIVDLKVSSTMLSFQVVANGNLIYVKDSLIAESFATNTYNLYLTFNDDRKEILEEVMKSGTVYG